MNLSKFKQNKTTKKLPILCAFRGKKKKGNKEKKIDGLASVDFHFGGVILKFIFVIFKFIATKAIFIGLKIPKSYKLEV